MITMQHYSGASPQPGFAEIKSAAKKALKNRWPEAIAVSLVFLASALLNMVMQAALMTIFKVDTVWSPFSPTDVPAYNTVAGNGITVFSAAFSLTVMFPLIYGVMRWFWLVTGGCDPKLGDIFYYFSSGTVFANALLVSVGLFLCLIIGAVISFLPHVLLNLITMPDFYDTLNIPMPHWVDSLTPLIPVTEVIGFLLLMLWVSVFAMFYAVMFNEPRLSAFRILRTTVAVTRYGRVRFVGFTLSFFGWFLLTPLMLPLLFTVPYFLSSLAVYGREIYRSATRIDRC